MSSFIKEVQQLSEDQVLLGICKHVVPYLRTQMDSTCLETSWLFLYLRSVNRIQLYSRFVYFVSRYTDFLFFESVCSTALELDQDWKLTTSLVASTL